MGHSKTTSNPVEAKNCHNRLQNRSKRRVSDHSTDSLISLKKQKLMDVVNTEETLPLDSNAIGAIQDVPLKSDDINSTSRDTREDEAANEPVFSPFVGHSVSEDPTEYQQQL